MGFNCHSCQFYHAGEGVHGSCYPVVGDIHAYACCNLHTFAEEGKMATDFVSGEEAEAVVDIEDLVC